MVQDKSYNGGPIEIRTWSIERFSMTLLERPQTQSSRSGHSLTLNVSDAMWNCV